MSKDKRKRFKRACDFLFEINNGAYSSPSLNGTGPFSMRNPVLRYILKRQMAKLVRVRRGGQATRTHIETGYPWARRRDA